MSADYVLPPRIVIVIQDNTLALSELEGFTAEYTTAGLAPVTIESRWGGPAADGLGVEIAVAIMAGELLRQVGSDAYGLAKRHILHLYHKIRPHSAARTYTMAALALVAESVDDSVVLSFCFPPGMTDSEIVARWHDIEQNWARLMDEWSARGPQAGWR